ncbi:hypothetical protein [Acinetobacter indicus]|uniref:hypothetical protein n=1 Tax=Acinetobacter indicus TaxID=756892 RepID=UPI0020919754|nr:hypothetical protein [Acinetobacter indicus]
MSIATDIVGSSIKVYEAALEDKARTTVVETVKLGTGIIASIFTAALIVGLATGGTGLIIIGIVAVSAALATKGASEIAGYGAGYI